MHSLKRNFLQHIAQTSDSPLAIQIERAEGVYMYDNNNKAYIDCISGISVSNVGHANPLVNEAIKKQLDKHLHLMVYGEIVQKPQVELAQKLITLLPEGMDSVYFVNSGSEAVEGAMKLAKRYTGKHRFVALKQAYHGSTHGALSLMSDSYFTDAFVPLLPAIDFINQNNHEEALSAINSDVAAVFMEPIMSEKGYVPCSQDFLQLVANRCKEVGALLVFDEIQSGMGRTGQFFAFQHGCVQPDIVLMAKAFGGGLPLGAFVSSKNIMQVLMDNPVLGHITTFGGHPLSCAASLAAIQYIHDNGLMSAIPEKEQLFRRLLVHPLIKEISGIGLMLAISFDNKQFARQVIDQCVQDGLLIDWFLFAENKIRLSPPLIIETHEINEICRIILKNINQVSLIFAH
jgi:acetylornithine/N-succinyldiaminopimelate aminotransferase